MLQSIVQNALLCSGNTEQTLTARNFTTKEVQLFRVRACIRKIFQKLDTRMEWLTNWPINHLSNPYTTLKKLPIQKDVKFIRLLGDWPAGWPVSLRQMTLIKSLFRRPFFPSDRCYDIDQSLVKYNGFVWSPLLNRIVSWSQLYFLPWILEANRCKGSVKECSIWFHLPLLTNQSSRIFAFKDDQYLHCLNMCKMH